ncbi:NUDIX hydrolase [Eoetvoesiella caeni]
MRAATKDDWQELKPLQKDAVTIPLGLRFDDHQMDNLRLGFIPPAMEFKWFAYFEGEILHVYRSWTGYKAAEVVFNKDAKGWTVPSMRIAIDAEFFSGPLDEASELILAEIEFYASDAAHKPSESSFMNAIENAAEPNYLGSPSVISDLLSPFFRVALSKSIGPYVTDLPKATFNDVIAEGERVASVMCGSDKNFHGLESWRTESGLGKAVILYFGLDQDWYSDESMACIMSEGLGGVSLQISEIVKCSLKQDNPDFDGLVEYIKALQSFVSSVLMGTNTLYFKDARLADFIWENAGKFVKPATKDEIQTSDIAEDTESEQQEADPSIHPRRNEQGNIVRLSRPCTPTKLQNWLVSSLVATCIPDGKMPSGLNGIPFLPWVDYPITAEGWEYSDGMNDGLDEPLFNCLGGKKPAAGAVIVEPDGRVWVVHPSNQFGGYKATFPKGRAESLLPLQATALREAFEETGLQIEITGLLGDFQRTTTTTRLYLARRIGGTPTDMGWESQAVSLVPLDELPTILNGAADAPVIAALMSERHSSGATR